MTARKPNVLWAQSKDKIFFTIDVQEAERPQVKLDNDSEGTGIVTFRGKAKSHAVGPEDHDYELDLELFGAVSPDDSKISVTARSVFLLITKKEAGEEYWPRLTKAKAKQANVKVDWDKWVDEDDEEEKDPASQFDLSSLGALDNFSGGGDLGGGLNGAVDATGADGATDSDDEDLPELESA